VELLGQRMRILLYLLKRIFFKKLRYTHILAFVQYNSTTKIINFLKNEYARHRRKIVVSSKPYLINAEPTSHCNFSCLFCPTGKGPERKGGFSDIALYEKIFKQVGKYVYLMTLHGWGEPLLHKNLPEIVSMAHKHRIFTVATTNGSMLNPETAHNLISSNLDYLIFSIDGCSEETYQKYRSGGSFNDVFNNMVDLVHLKKKLRSNTPFIEWQFIVFKHNEHEIPMAKKMANEIGVDNIAFMPAYTEDNSYDASDNKYHLPKNSPLTKPSECRHLWSTLTFHWDGKVVPCCYDYNGEVTYGNLLRHSFDDIWNNRKFRKSRKMVKNGNPVDKKDLYCNSCLTSIEYQTDSSNLSLKRQL
jgi:radical SAM protein with 4Fe4S-binding SPASM domain